VEDAPAESAGVAAVMAADLIVRVRKTLRKLRALRKQQQPRGFDRVARDADDARFLPLLLALPIDVDDASHLAIRAVLDARDTAFRPQIELACRFSARDL